MTGRLLTLVTATALALTAAVVAPAAAGPPHPATGLVNGPSNGPVHGPVAEVVAVDLGTLGGDRTVPLAVNGRGQVVGRSQVAGGQFHAFLWQDGVMTDLTPGDTVGAAVDVNDRGQVLGWGGPAGVWVWHRGRTVPVDLAADPQYLNDRGHVVGHDNLGVPVDEAFFPVLWERGDLTPLGPGPVPGFPQRSSFAWDLSERGAVLARGLDPSDDAGNTLPSLQPGYVWDDGVATPTPDLLPGPDLNRRGVVAGTGAQGALVWRDGVTRLLGAPRGATSATAVAINDRGQVAGTATVDGLTRAFRWRDGRFRDLGTPHGVETTAVAINERGDVAGDAAFHRAGDGRYVMAAFLARRGTTTLLRTPDDSAARVVDLDDRGMVVGVLGTPGVERGAVWHVPRR